MSAEQRSAAYTITDERIYAALEEFLAANAYDRADEEDWDPGWRLDEWTRWTIEWMRDPHANPVPPPEAWLSPTSPFPVVTIAYTGVAGSGKTVSVANMHHRMPAMMATGSVNKVTEAYLASVSRNVLPNCVDYLASKATLFRNLNVSYSHYMARTAFDSACKSIELNGAMRRFVEETFSSESDVRASVRALYRCAMETIRPLCVIMYDNVRSDFLKGGYRYRFIVEDPASRYYQARCLDDIRQWEKKGPDSTEVKERRSVMAQIKSQEDYVQYLMPFMSDRYPPHPALFHNVLMSEEDGKSPGIMFFLAVVHNEFIRLFYNPPHSHTSPFAYFSSGSDTQCGPIQSSTSPLELLLSDIVLSCEKTALAVQSFFYRRGIGEMGTPEERVHAIMPTCLESSIPLDNLAISTMFYREVSAKAVADPGHNPTATRLFVKHADVSLYNDNVQRNGVGLKAVTDVVFVSSYIVDALPPSSGGRVHTRDLSVLSVEQAERNRAALWREKQRAVYENLVPGIRKRTGVAGAKTYPYSEDHDRRVNRLLTSIDAAASEMAASDGAAADGAAAGRKRKFAGDNRVRQIYMEEYLESMGKHRENFTRRQRDLKRMVENPASGIEDQAEDEEDEEKETNDGGEKTTKKDISKLYIKGPAKLLLSMDEHESHRIYVDNIAEKLGVGENFAKQVSTSSKAPDQTARFEYDPKGDLATVYMTPTTTAAADSRGDFGMAGLEVHLAFTRKRKIPTNGPVSVLSNRATTATLRGVYATLSQILGLTSDLPPAFVILMKFQAVAAYRQHLVTKHLCAGYHRTNKDNEDFWEDSLKKIELDEKDRSLLSRYSDRVRSVQHETARATTTTSADEVVEEAGHAKGMVDMAILNSWLIGIRNRDGEFAEKRVLELYAHESPFYPMYRRQLSYSGRQVIPPEGVTFLGNYKHRAVYHEAEEARRRVPQQQGLGGGGSKTWENAAEISLEEKNRMKSEHLMTPWAVSLWYPDLYYSTVAVLLVHRTLIVSTKRGFSTPIKWDELFRGEKTIGLMMRKHQLDINTPDREGFHQLFRLPYGEDLQYPRPFKENAGSKDSGIIVKTTTGKIKSYAKGVRESFGPTYAGYKREANAAVGMPCPVVSNIAQTCHFAQGSTIRNEVYFDLQKFMRQDTGQFILGQETSEQALLIALTRPDRARNVRIANVNALCKQMKAQKNLEYFAKKAKKRRLMRNITKRAMLR